MKTLTILPIFAITIVSGLNAAILSFDGDTDSTWEDATNWTTDTVATGSDQITIGAGFNVTRASALTLTSIDPGTLLISSGGSLTISGDLGMQQSPSNVDIQGLLTFSSGGTRSNLSGGLTQGTYSLTGTMTFSDYENGIASSGVASGAPLLDFVALGATMNAQTMDAGDFANINGKFSSGAFFIGINGTQVNFGASGTDEYSGTVGGIRLHQTRTANTVVITAEAIPEPSSVILCSLGSLFLLGRRKRL